MVRTQIQLTDDQAATLKELSAVQQVSIACLIRQGIKILLTTFKTANPEERRQRALSIAGRFHSGKSDLSAKHDEYLNEAYKK